MHACIPMVDWGEKATAAPNGTAAEEAPAAAAALAAKQQQDQEPAQQPGA
jgi:hypothetical protein